MAQTSPAVLGPVQSSVRQIESENARTNKAASYELAACSGSGLAPITTPCNGRSQCTSFPEPALMVTRFPWRCYSFTQVCAIRDAAVAAERERWRELVEHLRCCRECGESDVRHCHGGSAVWKRAFGTDPEA